MATKTEYFHERKADKVAYLVGRNSPMVITSNYKGVILTQPIRVLSIIPGRVIFEALEPKLSFTLKEMVHLYSPAYREIVSARLLKLNAIKGKLELSDLTFTGRCWNERQYDRVQPRDPVYVYVEHKKALVRANLENLSAGGMSLMACNYKEEALHTDYDTLVRLTLKLPDVDERLELKGKVVQARRTGRLVINGVKLMASSAQEKRINRYVMARKAEILAELERNFREISEQPRMPSLYN